MRISSTTDTELAGARALGEWITGEPRQHTRIFLLDEGVDARALAGVVDDGDAVLVPEGDRPVACPGLVVRYHGTAREIGDELHVGDRGVELQDYVAAAFVHIVGPTAVVVVDDLGRQAFIDDAALARRTGVFPSALIDPRVILAGRGALADPSGTEVPRTFRIGLDGRVGVGMRGDVIGHVDDLRRLVSVPQPRSVALGGVTCAAGAGEVPDVHGIERYLLATDLMKMLRLTNGDARIDGFGWALVDDGEADADPRATDPFLVETADGVVLADTGTLRRHLLAPVTAQVVAVTQTSRSADVAATRLARCLGVPHADADALGREAIAVLGIHHGIRAAATASRLDG